MKLISIKPFFFRAFCDNPPITFNESLTIFYGENGAGKSSLSESLEWLLYGYTKRRRKGDEYSKNEYKGSYVHSACPTGTAPYVEAEIRLDDNSTHLVRRTIQLNKAGLPLDQDSTLSIDGNPVVDFSPIGVTYSEAQCPVIVQHGIQDFIHTRPIDRYRVISEALGLSELVEFKDILEKAKNYRRNNPSPELASAKTIVAQLTAKLETIELTGLAVQWRAENYSVDTDYTTILDKAREMTGSNAAEPEIVIKDVRNRQTAEINKVFDISPFRPNPNLTAITDQASLMVNQTNKADTQLRAAAAIYAGAIASNYQAAQMEFWKRGLSLRSPATPQQCPFCEEATLTEAKTLALKTRVQADEDLSKAQAAFVGEVNQYMGMLSQLELILPQLELRKISNENISTLEKLFESDKARLQGFAADNQQAIQTFRELHDEIAESKKALGILQTSVPRPDKVLEATNIIIGMPERLEKAATSAIGSLKQYNETFTAFTPIFERELSDEATVAIFTNLIDILNNRPSVQLAAAAKSLDAELIEGQRLFDDYILAKQKAALASREAEILTWYGLLSPNTDVRFSGLEPGRNEFNLKAEAFGRTMNAAASLSQSQLNCLGLSIYIPSVCDPDSPFKFILFDDPVQAMDDDHHESFLINVVPELTNKSKFQVIVLTHLKETADRLRDINFIGDFVYFRFDKLKATGPVVVEHIVLSEDMKKIRQLAQGNDDNRQMAVDRIRVLCENIMREAYLRHVGSRMPVASGTSSTMIPYFAKTPSVTPAMVTEIQDTIKWSNPAHHTQPGYIVPSFAHINPHIERLQKMINDLGLKK
jgi:energy-coupling factor transporter ATP-binding protein EcfA2